MQNDRSIFDREDPKLAFRATSDKQIAALPITRSSKALDSTRVILGLKNFGFFWVVGATMLVLVPTGNMPAGVVTAALTYLVIKKFVDSKPEGFLLDYIKSNTIIPRNFTHRSGRI